MKNTKGILTKNQYLALPSFWEYERKRIAVALHIKINPKIDVSMYKEFRILVICVPITTVTDPACGPNIDALVSESEYINATPMMVFSTRAADDIPYRKTVKPPTLLLF
jgi:hypothetical protein